MADEHQAPTGGNKLRGADVLAVVVTVGDGPRSLVAPVRDLPLHSDITS